MQKIKWYWLLMLSIIGGWLVVVVSQPVTAQADYSIDHYRMHVTIQKDGNAVVTQTMTYEFDEDYHGVFNVQDLRGLQGATVKQVTSRINQGAVKTATAATSGANNTYQLTQNQDRFRIKLYRAVSDIDRLQVTYRYDLRGVVTNYADTAELNWKLIGTGWDVDLDDVRLTIQLPAKHIKALQAWTHGPLSGQTKVDRQAGKVVMTVASNPANQFVESHLLFPTSVTATNQRTSTKKRKAAVQKQEAALAKQANAKRQQYARTKRVIYGVTVALLVGTLLVIYWWLRRHPANPHQRPLPIKHYFEVPTVAPAVAQSLWRTRLPDTQALSAEILRAAAAKEIKLETVPGKRHPDVVLTKLKPLTNSFLATCFDQVTTTDTLTFKQLKQFGKRDKKGRLNQWFETWQHEVDRQVATYQDLANYTLRSRWLVFAVLITVFSAIVTVAGGLISPVMALASGVVTSLITLGFWIVAIMQRKRLIINTDAGLVLVGEITGFRQMLKDIGHFNTAEIGDLILWEQILPYATAFGLAQRVAAKLQVDFGSAALADGMLIYYPIFYGDGGTFDLSGVIGDSLSGALSASSGASSAGGNSGGFSGGSSGGFGGGSGGGAF
ncbi:DUF2207 domain-containing protein [Lactiplantibacillus daowaiensis]|uniref:DUF2207 domain-containing protein n=1 Tax=Lactiplantibacillus daowaiensis TaxID=2559918 RepID=A0ABW1RYG1_9LACO|nr:DUF2207 domain-containing protein [Lactiplantibacillus daowaiensis]